MQNLLLCVICMGVNRCPPIFFLGGGTLGLVASLQVTQAALSNTKKLVDNFLGGLGHMVQHRATVGVYRDIYLRDREVTICDDVHSAAEAGSSMYQVHLLAGDLIFVPITQRQVTAHVHRQQRNGSSHADLSAPDDRHLRMPGHDRRRDLFHQPDSCRRPRRTPFHFAPDSDHDWIPQWILLNSSGDVSVR